MVAFTFDIAFTLGFGFGLRRQLITVGTNTGFSECLGNPFAVFDDFGPLTADFESRDALFHSLGEGFGPR